MLHSPKGALSIYVLNKSDADASTHLTLDNSREQRNVYKYEVMESAVNKPDFEMNPLGAFEITGEKSTIEDKLLPMSITVYTTYKLMDSDPGITTD